MIKKGTLLFAILSFSLFVFAQQIPIGSWQSHFSYLTANTIELVGDKILTGSNHIVSYSLINHEYTTYSKVNGMSDIGVQLIR